MVVKEGYSDRVFINLFLLNHTGGKNEEEMFADTIICF